MHRCSFPIRALLSLATVLVLLSTVLPVRASGDFILYSAIPPAVDTAHSAIANITVAANPGFTGTVGLTEMHSSGLSCDSINPSSITGSGIAILSCHSSALGLYNVSVTGVSGSISHATMYQVKVNASAPSPAPDPKPATILGLSLPVFYAAVGTVISLAASSYVKLRGRKRPQPQTSVPDFTQPTWL